MADTPKPIPSKKSRAFLERYSEAEVPTSRGPFLMVVFRDRRTALEHVALVRGNVSDLEGVPVRIHSECLTSEVFGSLKCDCRQQFDRAMDFVAQNGCGVVLYLRQEGRGIGLGNKIKAYALQAQGLDTYDANRKLGFADDLRTYDIAAEMLRTLGIHTVDLITNNPLKIAGLVDEGIAVRRRIPARASTTEHNEDYLRTKRERSGHLIELVRGTESDDDLSDAG